MSTKEPPKKEKTGRTPDEASLEMWERLRKQYAAEDLPLVFSSGNPEDRIGEYRLNQRGTETNPTRAIVLFSGAIRDMARKMASWEAYNKQSMIRRVMENSGSAANDELNALAAAGQLEPKTAEQIEEDIYKRVIQHELAHHRQQYEIETLGYDSPAGKEAYEGYSQPNEQGGDDQMPPDWHGPHFMKHARGIASMPFNVEHYGIKRPPSEYEGFDSGAPRRGRFAPTISATPFTQAPRQKPLAVPTATPPPALPPLQ